MWQTVAKYAIKIAVWAVGHQSIIKQTVADAKAKNISGIVHDATTIVTGDSSDAVQK